jgi:hypothetical protein
LARLGFGYMARVAESTKCCASFVQMRPEFRKLMEHGRWLHLPKWVDTEIDIPLPPSVLRNKGVKSDLRNIRKDSLTYDVTKDKECFDDFYYSMYVPYAKNRHEDSAFIMGIDAMRKGIKGSELIRVIRNGVPVAEMIIRYLYTGPEFWIMGIRDGKNEFVPKGIIAVRLTFPNSS